LTAIRPPEYFPRLPVAALLLAADRFVLADTFPFSRQGAHNRARIRTSQGAQWLTVPRAHGGETVPLVETGIVADGWARRHLHALRTAYGMAPFYDHLIPEIAHLVGAEYESLADLTCAATSWSARHLGATTEIVRASALPGTPATLAACWSAAGAGRLATLPESAARDARALAPLGAEAVPLRWTEPTRRQVFPGFEPGLSVLDLLMTHGPGAADVLRAGLGAPDR
jgi:hypothetical protein